MDLIVAGPARGAERDIAPHPSIKPQLLMRQLVAAALLLGKGIILDPFMGSGSTIAAATSLGLRSVGIEVNDKYYDLAKAAIPKLAALSVKMPERTARKQQRKKKIAVSSSRLTKVASVRRA